MTARSLYRARGYQPTQEVLDSAGSRSYREALHQIFDHPQNAQLFIRLIQRIFDGL